MFFQHQIFYDFPITLFAEFSLKTAHKMERKIDAWGGGGIRNPFLSAGLLFGRSFGRFGSFRLSVSCMLVALGHHFLMMLVTLDDSWIIVIPFGTVLASFLLQMHVF
jgi:hypothetical protein